MLRFIIVLLISAALLALGVEWARSLAWLHGPSYLYVILAFLVLTTGVIYSKLYKVNRPGIFVQLYLLTMALKILLYAVFNLVIILKDRPGAAANVAFFMCAYVVFTGLEIAFLYRRVPGNTGS